MSALKVIVAISAATYAMSSGVLFLIIMADFMGMPETFGRPDAFSMSERRYVLLAIAPAFLGMFYALATYSNKQKEK